MTSGNQAFGRSAWERTTAAKRDERRGARGRGCPATRPAIASSSRSPPTAASPSTRGRADRRHRRLRDVGHARRHGGQRRAALPRLDRRQPRHRPGRAGASGARLVGGDGRAGQADRHRPVVRRVRQRARRLPGHRPGRRRRTRPTAGRTGRGSRCSRSGTWCGPRPAWPMHLGDRPLARRHRRLDGRHAGRWSGRSCTRSGCVRSCRSPRACRRRRSRSRWGAIGRRAIALDPRWRGGDYYDAEPGDGPDDGLAVARMVAQVTFRSDNVFTDRFGRGWSRAPMTASACGSSSRSSATSSTTAPSSGGGSTPTATSSSARRWTSTTSPAAGAASPARWPASRRLPGHRHLVGPALPELPAAPDRRGPALGGRVEPLRRDRLTARPRRVPDQPRSARRADRRVHGSGVGTLTTRGSSGRCRGSGRRAADHPRAGRGTRIASSSPSGSGRDVDAGGRAPCPSAAGATWPGSRQMPVERAHDRRRGDQQISRRRGRHAHLPAAADDCARAVDRFATS